MIEKTPIFNVLRARHIGDYRLELFFSDGMNRLIDFGPFLKQSIHPDIRRYLDQQYFKQFTVENGDLIWGDYDLCFPVADLHDGTI